MRGLPSNAPVDSDTLCAGIHPEDISRVETVVQRCIDPEGERVYDIEYRVIRKNDGVERWIATRGNQFSRTASRSRFTASPWILLIGSVLSSTSRPEAATSQLGEVSNHLLSQIEQRVLAEAELNNCSGSMRLGKSRQASHTTSIIC